MLTQPTINLLQQLQQALLPISKEQYTQPSSILFGATIGQHIRHIIELFIELNSGYETGLVNYDKRKRDYIIETEKQVAINYLQEIANTLQKPNKALQLTSDYNEVDGNNNTITTNYFRELLYNIEHTVHHMALIRIGIFNVANIALPEHFGLAASTIKYKLQCAQ
jgi:uncharacterized damage-inducible protein DinB